MTTDLVERDKALAALGAGLRGVAAEGGRIALVAGEAGIGKTCGCASPTATVCSTTGTRPCAARDGASQLLAADLRIARVVGIGAGHHPALCIEGSAEDLVRLPVAVAWMDKP